MLNDLAEIIKIQSVLSEPTLGAPFGENCKAALDWFLLKAKSYGLETGSDDGYYGWAQVGDGEGLIGILCHLDVVPAGSGWSHDPYSLVNEDGYLYGRGVVDDKGSAVVALHILKALKQNNVKLKNRIRLIVGLNEENGSLCIKRYRATAELPKLNIVPDADFPIISSEKGIAHINLQFAPDEFFNENIADIAAGNRPNVVPDLCTVQVKPHSFLAKQIQEFSSGKQDNSLFFHSEITSKLIAEFCKPTDFSCHYFPDKIILEARGIAGHAMAPEKGENAFSKMIILLQALKGTVKACTLDSAYMLICNSLATEKLGIADSCKLSGDLTMNIGIAKLVENALILTLDIRLPITSKIDDVCSKILAKMPSGTSLRVQHFSPNLFIDPTSQLVQTLLQVYQNITGEKAYTVQSGGGTYARELPHSVAFGPTFPGAITNIHNADECISVTEFYKLYDIYYAAIMQLDTL